MELIDRRRQPWPGFEAPVDCYLFGYSYRFPRGTLRGVGIVGPVVHALAADLTGMPADDIYAIYAGWHAEHEDIRETDAPRFTPEQARQAAAARQELEDLGYDEVSVVKLGHFFDEMLTVATARCAGEPCTSTTSGPAP